MPYVTSELMLRAAREGGYAVGAFNVENLEMAQAVVWAAEAARAPALMQTTPGTLKYADPELFAGVVKALGERASVPVALHLDHGDSFARAARCLHAGYSSIMIDGSKLALPENIALTRLAAEMCHAAGVPVEGELGRVGGKEDDTVCEDAGYTDPDEAERFARESGADTLAVGVGTAHGVYKRTPVLNVELISTLRARLDIPLVLHGASGLSDEVVADCVRRGICKVNFATELRIAYTEAARAFLAEDTKAFDPKKFGAPAREAVQQLVIRKMQVCGCAGRA